MKACFVPLGLKGQWRSPYVPSMELDTTRIAAALAEAPVWAKIGLIDRDSQMRERAGDTIAAIIASKLVDPVEVDARQMVLPIT